MESELIRAVRQGMTPPGLATRVLLYPDDRFEWVEITTLADSEPQYIIARCKHVTTADVESCVTGEILARICLICDAQLGVAHGNAQAHT